METAKQMWQWMTEAPRHRTGLRVFQSIIGLAYLYRIATEGPFAGFLWGPGGVAEGTSRYVFGAWLGNILDVAFRSMTGTYLLLAVCAAGCMGLVMGRATRLASGATLLCLTLLEQRLTALGDGGDNVARLALFYFIFALPPRAQAAPGSLRVWVHNLAVVATLFQGMVVYTTAGLMKAFGEKWTNGTALYVISQVNAFSDPLLAPVFQSPIVVTVATYTTVLFQVWFAVAVLSRLRLVWLAIGVLMHGGIAVMMGLITFSGVMMAMDFAFITDSEYAALGRHLDDWRGRLRGWARRRWRRPAAALPSLPALPSLRLFMDGHCPVCRATADRLQRWDAGGSLELRSFRHDDSFRAHGIDEAALERRMHAVDLRTGAVLDGFAAVLAVVRAVPRLRPLWPVLRLGGLLGLGDRLYDAFARRRAIVPDPRACFGVCPIPGRIGKDITLARGGRS
jgi:predicted DCC family thiol-disulfide oxidoreductase YuxK